MSTLPPSDFTPVQAQVIAALAAGSSISAAAIQAGIHRSTIHNWINSAPDFTAAVESARTEFKETLSDQIRDLSALALQAVQNIIIDPAVNPSVRLRAALAVLNRPRFPEHGWTLPETLESPEQQQRLHRRAELEAAYTDLRRQDAVGRAVTKEVQEIAQSHCEMKTNVRRDSTLFDTLSSPVEPSCAPARKPPQPYIAPPKTGRNEPCPCGSGQKYKRCCGNPAAPQTAA